MKFGSLRALGAVCLCAVLCFPLRASAQADRALLQRVDDHYNHLHTLRARYSEHYTGMGLDRTETGTLTLKKPGLMRWSYDSPAGKVFVLDGKFAWFYTPGDAQVARTPAKQLDDLRSPLRFLLGHTQLAKELEQITTAPVGTQGAGGQVFKIAGVPKGMDQRVRQLTLVVTAAGVIQAMKIEEMDGAITDFSFTKIEEDVAVPASDFKFVPPVGLSVVNAQSPI